MLESELQTKLTVQQRAAIEARDVSVALSAGAGCGKTFVLTQKFLTHLGPGTLSDSLHKLVAITFTERAAREMRDRIREACRLELDKCPEDQATHWQQIIRGLDSARIRTIHSFCAALLRSHAVEAIQLIAQNSYRNINMPRSVGGWRGLPPV